MVAVTSLLVLACAWAAAVAYPLGEQCGFIKTGSTIGFGIPLAKTPLQRGVADFEIIIPNIPNCPNGLIGVTAIVCDYDVLPSASFISINIISVHRVGNLNGLGSITPTVYCGNQLHNNPPSLQNNQLWLSNNHQTNNQLQNDVTLHSNLWGQSPQSVHGQSYLPSLGLSSQSLLDQSHNPLLGQSQHSGVYGQSSLLSLGVTPLSQLDHKHNPLLDQSQLSHLWGQSSQSVHGQSSLPSLSVTPLSQLDHTNNMLGQSENSVWEQSPQSVYGQSSLPSLGLSPLSQLDHTSHNPLLCQSQISDGCGQPPHQLLGQSSLPMLQLEQSRRLISGTSSLPLLGQSSQPLLGNSPQNLIAQAY